MSTLSEHMTELYAALTVDAYVRKPTTALAVTGPVCCDRAPVPMGTVCVFCRMEMLEWADARRQEESEWVTEWNAD